MILSILYTIIVFFYLSCTMHFLQIAFSLQIQRRKWVAYSLLFCQAILACYTTSEAYHCLKSTLVYNLIGITYFSSKIWIYFLIFRHFSLRLTLCASLSLFLEPLFSAITSIVLSIDDQSNGFYILNKVLLCIIMYVCIHTIKLHHLENAFAKYINQLKSYIYILIMITIMLISLLLDIVTYSYTDDKANSIIQTCTILLLFILFAVITSIIRIAISEQEKTELSDLLSKQIENQVVYYEKINTIYDEFRSFRHDFKNHILCLESILKSNDIPQALKYIEEIIDLSSGSKPQYDTGSVIIDALLDDKSQYSETMNISIHFQGCIPTTGIRNIDLCTIFANAIDNAIEACCKSNTTEKKYIDISSNYRQGYYFLTVSNPIFESICTEKGRIITSKKNKHLHGFGLANIIKTVKKYNGETNIRIQNHHFILDISLLLNHTIT